jgi:hypothetical protein
MMRITAPRVARPRMPTAQMVAGKAAAARSEETQIGTTKGKSEDPDREPGAVFLGMECIGSIRR